MPTNNSTIRKYEVFDKNHVLAILNRDTPTGLSAEIRGPLHTKQVELVKAVFDEGVDVVFAACARKFGKSQTALYVVWRKALLTPHSVCYIVGPHKEHMAKVYWNGNRIQNYLGPEGQRFIHSVRYNEKSIELKNGSRIMLISSEDVIGADGHTPNIVVYDEFKGFHPEFHTVMDPNRTPTNAPLLIIGTLPTPDNRNVKEYNALKDIAKTDKNCKFFAYTTFDNPLMNLKKQKESVMRKIRSLQLQGKQYVVDREYYSKEASGFTNQIFPMFDHKKHVKPHKEIMDKLGEGWEKRMEKWCVLDPAVSTTFGGLFIAMHPENKRVFVLDELYITSKLDTPLSKVCPTIIEKMKDLAPKSDIAWSWNKLMDNAASRTQIEIQDRFPELSFGVTQKSIMSKDDGLSLIVDLMINDMIYISDRCSNLIDEILKYRIKPNGKVKKEDDHNIDCLRYFVVGSGYNGSEIMKAKEQYPEAWENLKDGLGWDREEFTWDVKEVEEVPHDFNENLYEDEGEEWY